MTKSKRNVSLRVRIGIPNSTYIRFTVGRGILTVPLRKWPMQPLVQPLVSITPNDKTIISMYWLSQSPGASMAYKKRVADLIRLQNRYSCLFLRKPSNGNVKPVCGT